MRDLFIPFYRYFRLYYFVNFYYYVAHNIIWICYCFIVAVFALGVVYAIWENYENKRRKKERTRVINEKTGRDCGLNVLTDVRNKTF
jgi:hypothetical protein